MKRILDACCGGRMFWFDKQHPDAVYMDNRQIDVISSNGQHFMVKPDILGDFRKMPFDDNSFNLVVFDPPHLIYAGKSSWLRQKYGCLNKDTWRNDLHRGFAECFRVLKAGGVLVLSGMRRILRPERLSIYRQYRPYLDIRAESLHERSG